ncbi:hypothetical protein L596_011205 [Steinernema carpocapsae]|uniref:PEP-utilising enzyme mobile domain-containing protein n=1 Tax=Steinernema carpocapsae TaxID=34508 RepID=A0A4U5NT16_STECR|nr:hypothetical protein L596_011205 [Steinernema carpocapsae]
MISDGIAGVLFTNYSFYDITNLVLETNWELVYEFDSPLISNRNSDHNQRWLTNLSDIPAMYSVFKNTVFSADVPATLEPGEILITGYTDIGWSPYFPLIEGLVTEIERLFSHGSVVAREYGLPHCVENATDVFKTRDEIVLDSKNGFVSRLTAKQ